VAQQTRTPSAEGDPRAKPAAPLPEHVLADIRSVPTFGTARERLRAAGRRGLSVVCLLGLDFVGLAGGLYAALALRSVYLGHPVDWGSLSAQVEEWIPFLVLVMILVFWQAGLYRPRERRAGFGRVLGSLVLVGLLTLAFAIGTGFEFNTYGLVPTTIVLSALLIGGLRASYDELTSLLLRAAGVRRRVLLVGPAPDVEHLHGALGSASAGIAYEFLGALSPSHRVEGIPHLGDLPDLPAVLRQTEVDELLVADSEISREALLEIVEEAHRQDIRVRIAPRTTALLAEWAEYIPGQAVPLFELRPPVLAGADWAAKRAFDLGTSALVLIVGAPIWLLIALAIKLTSPGPVFYHDRRVGLHEREFEMVKFRTMEDGAAAQQDDLEHANEADGVLFKIRDDPRVTPVGRLLRRLSLDEVPQVINVLRGEMSLVGPRPLPVRDYERLEDWHRKRSLVLPGVTGLWQISGRSELGVDDLVQLDFYYLERWSIWLDVSIILKTIPAVLGRRGAY
jgi:exopolysaccharide biosynthesis polyprenyl glycosylphosphotransferase